MRPADCKSFAASPGQPGPAPFGGAVEELSTLPDIEDAFLALSVRPHCVFFDSARSESELGRYSFLSADPFAFICLGAADAAARLADRSSIFTELTTRLAPFATETLAGLPPFQGGLAGLLGYDLHRALEKIPYARFDEFSVPALAVGLYDVVLAIDHVERKAWIVSQGWPEQDPRQRQERARLRLTELKKCLFTAQPSDSTVSPANKRIQASAAPGLEDLARNNLTPQFAVLPDSMLTSNFSRHGYLQAVARAIEYIHAGDIFQVNLSQRLLCPAQDDSRALYLRVRQRNPAPFAAYYDVGQFQIVSSSPERFLRVHQRQVEARPIKGTRRRSAWPEADLFAGDELLESEKDRAENVMIVDLMRNDISRTCNPDSVRVSELCRLETYEFVQHLVSVVQGELRTECGPFDLLATSFPGGSITGAPKVRAMEVIAELEPTARGAYCGCLGYVGFDGTMDTNILIRTITAGRGWWQFPVGGGIVAQSDPLREYEETWHKAEGMLRALDARES
jgi:para-aminobenzoate synthetase component 1